MPQVFPRVFLFPTIRPLTARFLRLVSSILPRLIDSDEVQTAHPYNFEDDDEVMAQRVAKVEQEEKMDLEKNAAPALMTLIAEKDKLLLQHPIILTAYQRPRAFSRS